MVEAVLPGPAAGLIGAVIDCALDTAKDNLDTVAKPADMQQLEKMFDLLLGELGTVVQQLVPLQGLPEQARQTLRVALDTRRECRQAARELQKLGMELGEVKELICWIAKGNDELLGLGRRALALQLDYVEEQRAAGLALQEVSGRLGRIEAAVENLVKGRRNEAEGAFEQLSREVPRSAELALGLGTAQYANRKFEAATKTLLRAHRLQPGDAELSRISRVVTTLYPLASGEKVWPPFPGPGDVFDGWRIRKVLGGGGWARVFHAERGGEVRAVKILHPELAANPAFESRFKRGIVTLANLSAHPNLVRIDPAHLFGRSAQWNCWYYLMDLVDGPNLQDHLTQNGPLSFQAALPAIACVIGAVAVLHERGIVHRNIKPGNILLRSREQGGGGWLVLGGFGLAGGVDAGSSADGHTPLFAAPEQLRAGTTSPRSDVYSLAATLYYGLTLDTRFKASLLPASVPPAHRALLGRCLDIDPEERPANAGEFLKALGRSAVAQGNERKEGADGSRTGAVRRFEEGDVIVFCPNCRRQLMTPGRYAGQGMRCPFCQAVFKVPPPLPNTNRERAADALERQRKETEQQRLAKETADRERQRVETERAVWEEAGRQRREQEEAAEAERRRLAKGQADRERERLELEQKWRRVERARKREAFWEGCRQSISAVVRIPVGLCLVFGERSRKALGAVARITVGCCSAFSGWRKRWQERDARGADRRQQRVQTQ